MAKRGVKKGSKRLPGCSLKHAASMMVGLWRDLLKCHPELKCSFWSQETCTLVQKMRQRAKYEESQQTKGKDK